VIKIEAATRLTASNIILLQNQLKALRKQKPSSHLGQATWEKRVKALQDEIKEAKKAK
jgi:hypothetical protein